MPYINYDENGTIEGGHTLNRCNPEQILIGVVEGTLKICDDNELHISDISSYDLNKYKIIDGVLTDISSTIEYITKIKAEEKKQIALIYKDKFNEFDGVYSARVVRGLSTSEEMNTKRTVLQNELTTKVQEVDNG